MRHLSLLAATASATFITVAACSSDPAPAPGSGNKDAGGAADARNPYPSFKDDVAPIIRQSCALTACHSSKESNLGIYLAYDPAQIYGELNKVSPTAVGERFVVAGDPANSYVMVKLEGKQAALAAKCTSGSCGAEMPPGSPLPAASLETVRTWIAEGAKDN